MVPKIAHIYPTQINFYLPKPHVRFPPTSDVRRLGRFSTQSGHQAVPGPVGRRHSRQAYADKTRFPDAL